MYLEHIFPRLLARNPATAVRYRYRYRRSRDGGDIAASYASRGRRAAIWGQSGEIWSQGLRGDLIDSELRLDMIKMLVS